MVKSQLPNLINVDLKFYLFPPLVNLESLAFIVIQ